MRLLVKASLRVVAARKLETLAVILIAALAVTLLGVMEVSAYNVERHVYLQMRNRIGDVMVSGVFDEDDLEALRRVEGVARVVGYKALLAASLEVGGQNYVASIVGESMLANVKVKKLEGSMPSAPGEAVIYWVLSGPPIEGLEGSLGATVTVRAFTVEGEPVVLKLRVVGEARGYEWLGGQRVAVVVDDDTVERLTGGFYTIVSLFVEDPSSADLERVASEARDTLSERGAPVLRVLVNDPDKNPIVALLKGVTSLFTVPAASLYLLLPALPAAAGSALAVREARVIAVMRALGASSLEVAVYYTLPWLVRGLIGVALGVALVYALGARAYASLFVRDSEIALLLYEAYGFKVDPGILVSVGAAGLAGVALGALVPLVAAIKVSEPLVLRSAELPVFVRPPKLRVPGPLAVREAIRGAAARPLKVVGLAVALSVVWGIAGAMESLAGSVENVVDLYKYEMPPDVFITVASINPLPDRPVYEAAAEAAVKVGGVKGYSALAAKDYVDALGLTEIFSLVTVVGGDPSVAFPLTEGRYPEAPGETVVSAAVAAMLSLEPGDTLTLSLGDLQAELVVVGVSKSRLQNGFYALVTPEFYEEVTGEEPGLLEATLHIDLEDSEDPRGFLERLSNAIKVEGYVAVEEALTRSDLVETLDFLVVTIYGVLGGILAVASLAAGLVIASLLVVDSIARAREIAALLAAGATPLRVAASYAVTVALSILLASPLAYASGAAIASLVAARSALAVGYLDPVMSPQLMLASAPALGALLVGAAAGLASVLINIRRTRLADVLRE